MAIPDLTKRYYREIGQRSAKHTPEHSIDAIVDRIPQIEAVDRAASEFAAAMRSARARRSDASWIDYEDLRLLQRTLRQERFFDVGYAMGRLAGIVAAQESLSPRATELRLSILNLAATVDLRADDVLFVLLDAARAFASRLLDGEKTASR